MTSGTVWPIVLHPTHWMMAPVDPDEVDQRKAA
jgi:hypothetical protein